MKRMLGRISVSAALLLVSLNAAGFATVHGVVTAQDTGLPLAGVTVTLGSDCGPDGCRGNDMLTTAADGSFSASDVHAGTAYVAAAYKPGQANYAPSDGEFFPIDDGAVSTVDIALAPGVTIQGTVRRASDGQPLADIEIALDTAGSLPYPDSLALASTLTDATGKYRFTQLHSALYVVKTRIQGTTPYQDQFYAGHTLTPPTQGQPADVLALAPGQQADTVDFSLPIGGRLIGALIDQYSGLPIANTNVEFQLLDTLAGICCVDFDRRGATTDGQGRFELDGLSDAPFYLSADAASAYPGYAEGFYGCNTRPCETVHTAAALNVPTGGTQTIEFLMFPNAFVSGTVTRRSDGAPIAGAEVDAYVPGYLGLRAVYQSVFTDTMGHYQLWGALAGAIYVGTSDVSADGVAYVDQAYQDQNCGSGSCNGLGQLVLVPEHQTVPSIDFQLDPGVSLSGQVLAKDTSIPVGSSIYVYGADGVLSAKVFSNPDGMFRTAGLIPGTYYLAASPYSHDFSCAFYGDAPCDCGTIGVCTTPPASAPGSAQSIVLGTEDVANLVIRVPTNEIVFANGFE